MRFLNLVKKILIAGLMIMGLFILVLVVALTIVSDGIGDKAVEAVKASMSSDLDVKSAKISMWTYFPSAAIKLEDITLTGQRGDTLLVAEEVAFKVSLYKLFKREVVLRTASLKNSEVSIRRYSDGQWNYDIFKTDTSDQTTSSPYRVAIDRAALSYCDIHYFDSVEGLSIDFFVLKSSVFTSYDEGDLIIDAQGSSVIDDLRQSKQQLLSNVPLGFDLKLRGHLPSSTYTFEQSDFKLGGIPFSVKGFVQSQTAGTEFDLKVHSEKASLEHLLGLLPEPQKEAFSHFRTQGYGVVDIVYAGRSTGKQQPELLIETNLVNIGLSSRRYDTKLEGMNASFLLHYRNKKTHLEFENTSGLLQSKPLLARAHIDLESQDSYSIDIDGSVPIALLVNFLPVAHLVKKADGNLQCQKLIIRHGPKYRTPTSGNIKSSAIAIGLEKDKVSINHMDIGLAADTININTFSVKGFNSDIDLSGTISNFKTDRKSDVEYKLNFIAKRLNIDNIVEGYAYYGLQDSTDSIQDEDQVPIEWNWPAIEITMNLEKVSKNRLEIPSFTGQISHRQQVLKANFSGQLFDGQLSGDIDGQIDDGIDISARLSGQSVDINQVLYQFENFDQEFVTDKHLKGSLDSKMLLDLSWDTYLNLVTDKIHMSAAMVISKGEIINLPLFQDFSTYVKVKDLEHVKFSKVHNLIQIKDGSLFLPDMFIQSNALNLRLSGEHSFEHQMDYVLQVNGGQTIINRFKKHDDSLQPLKARQKGFFNLYFRISGFPDNYQVSSDRKEVLDALDRSDIQRDAIRDRLINSYGPLSIFFDDSMKAIDMFSDDENEDLEYLTFE